MPSVSNWSWRVGRRLHTLAVGLLLAGAGAQAEIVFDGSPGHGPPPTTLGSHVMVAFPADPRPYGEDVTDVPSPLGGEVLFSIPVEHLSAGTWYWPETPPGYLYDVYFTHHAGELLLTLPPETAAFYLYIDSNSGQGSFEAIAQDGTGSGVLTPDWTQGFMFLGFHATDGDRVESIRIVNPDGTADGFGVATMGVARYDCDGPPEPAQGVQASDGGYADRVVVSWDADVCAEEYRVYRHTDDEPDDAVPVSDWLSGQLSFEDTTAELGVVYRYWVQARNAEGESEFSEADAGFAWPVALRVGTGASAADGPWPFGIGVPCPGE